MVLGRSLTTVAAILTAASALAEPFDSTDQNPLLGGFSYYAPARLAPARNTSVDLTLNWSSIGAVQQRTTESLVLDVETREWRLKAQHALTDRFTVTAEVPIRTVGAGTLDSTIEGFHDFFGLPNGDRSDLPNNQLRIDYRRGSRVFLDVRNRSFSGLGDVVLGLGWQARKSNSSATSLWSRLSLPTGDADRFTGADAFAASFGLSYTKILSSRFDLYTHVAGVYSNNPEPLGEFRKSMMWLGMAGIDYLVDKNFTLTIQYDVHSGAFDSDELGLMGHAMVLTFGGEYRFPSDWTARFGVGEDIEAESSPDVTFVMNLRKSF